MKRLVVYVPGIGQRCKSWEPFLRQLGWPSDDTALLPHDHAAGVWSHKSAASLAKDLASNIETWWNVTGPADDVILLGHSMGALLVRQAYLQSLDHRGISPKPWTANVSRIVLFSGINRGLELKRRQRLLVPVFFPGERLIKDLLSGSDFVTNLRIWWIKKLAAATKRPVVIQVRGGADDLIRREDSIDIEGFLEGHEVFVNGANHADILSPDQKNGFSDEKLQRLKYSVMGEFANERSPERQEAADQKVVFVVHGIRDSNDDWAAEISRSIASRVAGAEVIAPTFGRFSALNFAIPGIRRAKVRWFQDLYSMKLSRNPLAKFYFVGHSYGTFLVGHGVENLPGMEFERILLAGSVLPEQLDWSKHSAQVRELRNCRAHRDVPVAILCPALRGIGLGKGIGTAGYTGFFVPFGLDSELFFFPGGHDATIASEQARLDVLGFVEKGNAYKAGSRMVSEDKGFTRVSAAATSFGYLLLLLCVSIAGILTWISGDRTIVSFALAFAEVLAVALVGLILFLAYF